MISLGSQSSTAMTAAACAPSTQDILVRVRQMQSERDESSSSDSDAPISKAAVRLAMRTAAQNAQAAEKEQRFVKAQANQASEKRKLGTTQHDCTGSPKYHMLCICDFCCEYSMNKK